MINLNWVNVLGCLGLFLVVGCGSSDTDTPSVASTDDSPDSTTATNLVRMEGPAVGCGQSGASGDFSLDLAGGPAQFRVTLPPDYDALEPAPLVFAFHGRNRTHIELQEIDAAQIQTEIGDNAIVAYLKSQNGTGWNAAEEVEPNIDFFEEVYAQLLNNYCVDTGHVFAIGHSSGGYFSNILGCRFGDRIRGVGAVAGAQQESDCRGQVAAIVVHGVRDAVVSFESGQMARDQYLANNGCADASTPASVEPCVSYAECNSDVPVQWCEHNEPTYQDTNHGWPSFASQAIGDFLFALP